MLQIGAFLALSLTSLVLTISMLAMHTIALAQYILSYYGDSPSKSLELALTIALMCLVAVDFVCSVSAVALACEAYCKFCSTCDVRDCMVCQGCCECDGATYSEEVNLIASKAAFTLYRFTFDPVQKCSFSLALTLYRYSFRAFQVQDCSPFLAGTKLYRITLSNVNASLIRSTLYRIKK